MTEPVVGGVGRPLRVLHVGDTGGPGGAETVLSGLALAMRARGHQSVVAIPEGGWLQDTLVSGGVLPHLLGARRSFDVGFLRALWRLIRENDIDLVHAHLLTANVYSSVLGAVRGVPVVCTFHGTVDVPERDRLRHVKMRLVATGCRRVVYVSHWLRRHFEARFPYVRHKGHVIPNGVDDKAFGSERSQAFRTELGVDPSQVLVGGVGNIRPAKRYELFLHVAAALARRRADYRFVLVGEGSEAALASLRRVRRDLDLDDVVYLTGFREDVARVYQGLDVLLSTSTAEGFSLVTVQAMVAGVPVVSAASGGPQEIIASPEHGVIVESDDPEQFADAVEALMADGGRRARLVQAAQQRARSEYTVDRMLDRYEALYRELVEGPSDHAS